jgi:hypothetical protein
MRRLLIRNPDLSNEERSYLSNNYAVADGTVMDVISTFAFAADNFIVTGNPTEEKAEIKKISALTSDTRLALASALKFPHSKGSTVVRTPWDQVEISRMSGGVWTVLSTSGLQFDKQYTVYNDSTGSATHSYRWRFSNSATSTFSEYSPTFSGSGFDRDQAGYIVGMIRKLTKTQGDQNLVTDTEILRQISAAQDIVDSIRKDWYFLRIPQDSSIATQAGINVYNLDLIGGGVAGTPADNYKLGFIKSIKMRYNNGSIDETYNLRYVSETEFERIVFDQNRTDDDNTGIYTIKPGDSSSKNGYFHIYPTPQNTAIGTFYIDAYRKMDDLDDFSQRTYIPLPQLLEWWGISFVERIRGNDQKAEYYEELFYGPAPDAEDRRRLTGIALLEQLNERAYPTSQPRQLKKFMGRKAVRRLFGGYRTLRNRDQEVIDYW